MAAGALSQDVLEQWRRDFYDDRVALLAQNFVAKSDPVEACLTRDTFQRDNHVFSHKVEEVKPVTNQMGTGRCWIFAFLNAVRIPFMKQKTLEEFEFSQAYLFFWDKVERSNYFLNTVVEVAKREPKEAPDGRLMSFLLKGPISDGGQWDMVVNLVKKHGLMPKKFFPETYSCEASNKMNSILVAKLREFCFELIQMMEKKASETEIQQKIRSQMQVVYRIVGTCLGVPPKQFTWEYTDKAKKYVRVGTLTPLQFYEQEVKPVFDLDSKVCLVSDPRPSNTPGQTYTVDCLGNVVGGRRTIYNNQSIDTLIDVAKKSIVETNEPVWFGCDVSKHCVMKEGLLDFAAHNFELVYGTTINKVLSKANRLIYGASEMTHAMVLTGANVDEDTKRVTRWRVENSWGEESNQKGYFAMTTDWFKEFVFEVVVDKSVCPKDVLDVFDREPTVLPAWDPMGALARSVPPTS